MSDFLFYTHSMSGMKRAIRKELIVGIAEKEDGGVRIANEENSIETTLESFDEIKKQLE